MLLEAYHDLEWHETEAEAADEGTTPERLEQLSHAPDQPDVRYWVARNINTPPATLTRLAGDLHSSVRDSVEKNPSTPPMVKMWLTLGGYSDITLEEFLKATQET
jgi:hypothetical protein